MEPISIDGNLVSFQEHASSDHLCGRGAFIVVQIDGRICFAGAQARSWLVRYFDIPRATHLLPQPLIDWLATKMDQSSVYKVRDCGLQLDVKVLEVDGSGAICLLLGEQTIQGVAVPSSLRGLTPRETEVLALVSGGQSNAEIAGAMQLAVHTVKKHLQNIYIKLHVRNRTAAAGLLKGPQTLVVSLRGKAGRSRRQRDVVLQLASTSGTLGPERPSGRRFAA